MRKTYLVAAVVCCALLAIDTLVLVTPALAASCEIDCGGGNTLICTGDTCEVTEGVGCRAWEEGLLSEVKNCEGSGQ
jgi:hypothetical protein